LMVLTQSSGTYTSMNVKVEAKLNNTDITDATVVTMKYTITDPDSGDSEFTDGNTSGVDQYANFVGQTDFATHIVAPTTAQGLASVATIASSAVVSNATA
jgi:hypothetical protein